MHRMTNKAPEPYGDLDFACVVNPQRLVWILSGTAKENLTAAVEEESSMSLSLRKGFPR
jgi:hypothetical protein